MMNKEGRTLAVGGGAGVGGDSLIDHKLAEQQPHSQVLCSALGTEQKKTDRARLSGSSHSTGERTSGEGYVKCSEERQSRARGRMVAGVSSPESCWRDLSAEVTLEQRPQ